MPTKLTPQELAANVLRDLRTIQTYVENATETARWHDLESLIQLAAKEAARVYEAEGSSIRFALDTPTPTTSNGEGL